MEKEITGSRNIIGYTQYPVIHQFEDGLPYSLQEFESALPEYVHTHSNEKNDYIHFRFLVYTDGVVEFSLDKSRERILDGDKEFHQMGELYIQPEENIILFKFSNVESHEWGRTVANNTAFALEEALDDSNLFEESESFVSEAEYGTTHPALSVSHLLLLFTEEEIEKQSSSQETIDADGQEETVYRYSFEESEGFVDFNLTTDTLEPSFSSEDEPERLLKLVTKRLYTSDFGQFTHPFDELFDERWLYPFFLKHENPGIDFWESIQDELFNIQQVLEPSDKTSHLKESYGPIKSLKMFVDLYSSLTYSLNYIFEEQYEQLYAQLEQTNQSLPSKTNFVETFSEFEASLETLSKFDSLSDDFVNYSNESVETGDVFIVNSELGPAKIKVEVGASQPLLDVGKLKQDFPDLEVSENSLEDAFWCPMARPIEVLEITSFNGPEETAEEYRNFIKQNEDLLTYSMLESKEEPK